MAKAKVKATRAQVYNRGEWRFRIKAANGEILANGESYSNREDAVAAACAVSPPELANALAELEAAQKRGDLEASV